MESVLVAPVPNFGVSDWWLMIILWDALVGTWLYIVSRQRVYGHSHRGIRGGKGLCGDEDPIYGV